MPEENVDVVRRLYDAWGRGEFTGGQNDYADDVVFVLDFALDRATARGLDGMRELWFEQLRHWTRWRAGAIREMRDLGDIVLVINSLQARGHRSGAQVEIAEAAAVFRFCRGKVVWLLATDDVAKAERAVAGQEWEHG